MNRFTFRKLCAFTFFLLLAVLFDSRAQTLYSYTSGAYSDTTTWTTDPSGTTYAVDQNFSPNDPNNGSFGQIHLVILPGRTVLLDQALVNKPHVTIQAGGTFDVANFPSNLASLSGQGTLRTKRVVSGTIAELPVIDGDKPFMDTNGGTIEYYFAGTLQLDPTQDTYNNLTINLTNATSIAYTLNNLTLKGNLTVEYGFFRISDDTAPSVSSGDKRLTIHIARDVTVANTGAITVGKANTNTSFLTAAEFNGTIFDNTTGTIVQTQNLPGPFKIATPSATIIGPIPNKFSYYKVYHQVYIGGNFTNSGTVKFHNLTSIDFNKMSGESGATTPTTGAATVFFQGAVDKTITCNSFTDFYNLVVDKGGDPTYNLTINATSAPATASYFRLWGPNTLHAETAGNTEDPNPFMRKALWVKNGTLRLIGSTIIPSLSEGITQGPVPNSDYYIPTNAGILVDGPNAVLLTTADYDTEVDIAYNLTGTTGVTNSDAHRSSISMYGSLQINSGYVSTRESSGFVYWNADGASANLIMNGGTLDTKQIRPSVISSSNRFTFIMNGGYIRLRGSYQNFALAPAVTSPVSTLSASTNLHKVAVKSGTQPDFATFYIYLESSIFTMTGGTIDILSVSGGPGGSGRKALEINSSLGNYNVTGGSVNIFLNGDAEFDNDYKVVSSAPLVNLTIQRQSGTKSVTLEGLTSGYLIVKKPEQPLTILNNLTIESGVLNAKSTHDIIVGGDFEIKKDASLITGTSTTTKGAFHSVIFNGTGSQGFINSGFITTDGTTAGMMNLIINKPANTSLTLARASSFSQTLSFVVNKDFSLLNGIFDDGGRALRVKGNVNNSGKHLSTLGGNITLNGGGNQIISSNNLAGGIFGNLKLNNTNATFSTAHTVTGKLIFEGTTGILDIGIYALEMTSGFGDAITFTGSPFSSTKMVKTAGNQSDDGIRKKYTNNGEFLFPFGTGTLYTPAKIQINNVGINGTISVRPVVGDHPFITASPALPYYWKVLTVGGTDILGQSRGALPAAINATHRYYYYGLADNTTYIPGRYNPNSWTPIPNTSFVDEDLDEISFTNVPYLTEDFTAGVPTAFGAVTTYYSRQTGNWDISTTWTLDTLANTAASGTPTKQTPTIIRKGHTVTVTTPNKRSGSMNIQSGGILDVTTSTGHNFGAIPELEITGSGKLRISSSATVAEFPAGDFGNFISIAGGTVDYYTTGNVDFTIPLTALPDSTSLVGLSLETYRNLTISPATGRSITLPDLAGTNNRGLIILEDLTVNGTSATALARLNNGVGTTARTLTINGNINVNGGRLRFMNNAVRNVVLNGLRSIVTPGSYGNITIANTTGAGIDIDASPTIVAHTIIISGSLTNNGVFDVRNTGTCNVTFTGDSPAVIAGTGATTDFNLLTVDKGTSMAPVLTVTATKFTANSSVNWLTLLNGTLSIEKDGDFSVSKGTGNFFTIPATAALSLNHPAAKATVASGTQDGSDLILNGKLEILQGEFNIGTDTPPTNVSNDIEYAEVGSPTIIVRGGKLFVKGQIRRSLTNVLGSLHYIQSGGTVTIGGRIGILSDGPPTFRDQAQALALRRAKLEVLNAGSEFTMSGGTLTFLRGGGFTDWYGDLYLRPDVSSTVGTGTILFAPGTTAVGPQTYTVDSSVPLNNLTVSGVDTTNTATVNLAITPLVLRGNLTLSDAFSTFNTNSLNVSIGGNFSNSGIYLAGTNTTTFTGNTSTSTFNKPTAFHHLTITKSATFAGNANRSVMGKLTVTSGATLNDGTGTPTVVLGNIENSGTHTGNGALSLQKGVSSIAIDPNSSYTLPYIQMVRTSPRPVEFSGADSPAKFHIIIIDGVIKAINLVKGGTNFKETDQLIIGGGTGSGALANFTTGKSSGGSDLSYPITSVTILNGGSGYGPTATVTGGDGNIVVQTILQDTISSLTSTSTVSTTAPLSEIRIISPGTGYTTQPTITLTGAAITLATATAVMNGEQAISGNGNGQFGNVEIKNADGVNLAANAFVNSNVQFTQGILYIDDHLLTLGQNGSITGTPNSSQYIRTNGVISDGGVRKYFAAAGTPQAFTFPFGVSSKYTPAMYSMTVSQAGSLTVKPVNSEHPATTDFSADNALDYYWNVAAGEGFAVSSINHTYNYMVDDVSLEGGKTEADYISGYLASGNLNWTQGTTANVDEVAHSINFNNTANLTADYTAGTPLELSEIATYYSRNAAPSIGTGADWDGGDATNGWTTWSADSTAKHDGAAVTGRLPSNAKFIIAPTHKVNTSGNGRNAWILDLKGTLDVGSSIFNNFGTISGTGRLRISSGGSDFAFPGGNYDVFVSTTGGTIEYYGANPGGLLTQKVFNNLLVNTSAIDKSVNLVDDITVNGDLTISSGQLNNSINNQNITLNGNWATYATTGFIPGTGSASVYFTGTGPQTIQGATTFNHLLFSGSATKSILSSLTINKDLTIGSGVTVNSSSNSLLTLTGDWHNSGTFNAGTGANSTVLLNGNDQLIEGTGTTFNNLTITGGGNKILNSPVAVKGILTLTNGYIVTNTTNILTMNDGSSVAGGSLVSTGNSGGSPASFVVGPMKKIGKTSFFFPIGKFVGGSARLAPAHISLSSGTANTFLAEYFSGEYTNSSRSFASPLTSVNDVEYWNITGTVSTQITLTWRTSSNVSPGEYVYVTRYNNGQWGEASPVDGVLASTTPSNRVTSAPIGNFGFFTLGYRSNDYVPTPVSLLSFDGKWKDDQVDLKWITVSEKNNAHFEIERSSDAINFVSIGRLTGKGTTNITQVYNFSDVEPLSGIAYYRLKQVDIDGKYEYSQTVAVANPGKDDLTLFPNPSSSDEQVKLKVNTTDDKTYTVIVYDLQGRQLTMHTHSATKGLSNLPVSNSNLATGMYIVRVFANNLFMRQFKLIID